MRNDDLWLETNRRPEDVVVLELSHQNNTVAYVCRTAEALRIIVGIGSYIANGPVIDRQNAVQWEIRSANTCIRERRNALGRTKGANAAGVATLVFDVVND